MAAVVIDVNSVQLVDPDVLQSALNIYNDILVLDFRRRLDWWNRVVLRATEMGRTIPINIHPFPRRRAPRYVSRHHPHTLESYFERVMLSLMLGPSIRNSVVRNVGSVGDFALSLYSQHSDWHDAIGRIANDALVCKFILDVYETEQRAWQVCAEMVTRARLYAEFQLPDERCLPLLHSIDIIQLQAVEIAPGDQRLFRLTAEQGTAEGIAMRLAVFNTVYPDRPPATFHDFFVQVSCRQDGDIDQLFPLNLPVDARTAAQKEAAFQSITSMLRTLLNYQFYRAWDVYTQGQTRYLNLPLGQVIVVPVTAVDLLVANTNAHRYTHQDIPWSDYKVLADDHYATLKQFYTVQQAELQRDAAWRDALAAIDLDTIQVEPTPDTTSAYFFRN